MKLELRPQELDELVAKLTGAQSLEILEFAVRRSPTRLNLERIQMKSKAEALYSIACVSNGLHQLLAQQVEWFDDLADAYGLPDGKSAVEDYEELTRFLTVLDDVLVFASSVEAKLGHDLVDLRRLEFEVAQKAEAVQLLRKIVQISHSPFSRRLDKYLVDFVLRRKVTLG